MEMTEIIRELSETSALAKHNELQIQEMKEKICDVQKEHQALHDIATSVKLIAQDIGYIKQDVCTVKTAQNELRTQLSEVKQSTNKKKALWYDKVVGAVCGAIGMAILGYVLSNVFPVLFK